MLQKRPGRMSRKHRHTQFSSRHRFVEALEKRIVLSADLSTFVGPLPFVPEVSPDGLWSTTPGVPLVEGKGSYIHPVSFVSVALDEGDLTQRLADVPLEFTPAAESSAIQITLPTPDRGFARFRVVSSPIMAPELAAKFPEIQTFSGQGIDDPAATLRFDITPAGFHAQVLSPSGAYYIDPFWHLDNSAYISYYKHDLLLTPDRMFVEHEHADEHADELGEAELDPALAKSKAELTSSSSNWSVAKGEGGQALQRSGSQLRVYSLANAATAEYTTYHGATVLLGQAAIVTAINRVTGIYENELSIRLVLVSGNDSLVYTNAATDPYTNGDANLLLDENQANIDSVIGSANYDIGHVFSTGGGGLAALGVVGVDGQKAKGETGLQAPIGDPFYVDYVAHEMGHQFGGSHTFNSSAGSCGGGNRSASAAYEPGSGSTIQAYAGICGADNLQLNSDPYFHSYSFDQITQYVSSGAGNTAATLVNTGNSVPRVTAGPDYAIPTQTAFKLSAIGVDSNASDGLTYNWEQRDLGVSTTLAAADNGTSPIFRSYNPSTSTDRTFPRLAEYLNGTAPVGEKLPTAVRAMDFRVTVRDNRSGGGGVNTDDVLINVVNTGSPFSVTSPNTAVNWAAGSTQTITWNVAGTTAAPINSANVNIWLSTNGGQSFLTLLASNVANDGSETLVMPNVNSSQARIKIEPTNNVYFDVSDTNFTISGGTNSVPTISSLTNRWISAHSSTGSMALTVGDAQTAAANLVLSATSSNTALLPASSIVFGGSGANRTLTLTPAFGQFGNATVFVSVTDAGGLTSTTSMQLFVEGILACSTLANFDGVSAPALPDGWTSSASGVAATNWATSATSSDSGSNNAFVPNPINVSDSQLTSPPIAITTANRTIQFRNNYNLESGFDGGVMEISIDGGDFTDVITAGGNFTSGGYVSAISTSFLNPIGGRNAWTRSSNGYITTVVELPATAIGRSVRLRFRMGSDNSDAAIGWRVDTIQTCGINTPSVLSITATSASKNEGNSGTTPFGFVVTRQFNTSSAVSVQYAVTGSGALPADAADFGGVLPSGTISFAAGETSKTLTINVAGDTQSEGDETFTVTLSGATGDAAIDVASATGTIVEDENAAPTNINISQNTIAENMPVGSTVGSLSTVDSNVSDTFLYAFATGSGSTDNGSFAIVGNQLRTATALNFETKSTYSIRVRSTDQGGLFIEKVFSINLIDLAELSTPVAIGNGTAQRSMINSVAITFDGVVTVAPGAFVVDKLGAGGGTVATTSTASVNGSGQTVITLGFSGGFTRGTSGALTDGYYRLQIDGTKISRGGQQLDTNSDGIGGDLFTLGAVEADNFFSLYGDTSGDGIVGVAEFGQFRSAFGKTSTDGGYDVRLDYERDNVVGVSDFGQFRSRFGKPKMPF